MTVESKGAARYAQDIEAAVYFCCLEALQNVQKYAAAESARVEIEATAAQISFSVTDDGTGFDATRAKRGSGLTNMEDRVAAVGGTLPVTSIPGEGTRVAASLPAAAL